MQSIDFVQLLVGFVVLLVSLTVHEAAHAWTADRLGDPTARLLGRVSFNPAVHADLIGTVVFPLIAMLTHVPLIGWARPVPVDTRRLGHPRRDFMVVAAAGPASNLLLAVAATAALYAAVTFGAPAGSRWLLEGLLLFVRLNVMLAVFNMLPIPPLDGGNVLAGLLPYRAALQFSRLRQYGFLLLYGLLLTGLFELLVLPPTRAIMALLFAGLA